MLVLPTTLLQHTSGSGSRPLLLVGRAPLVVLTLSSTLNVRTSIALGSACIPALRAYTRKRPFARRIWKSTHAWRIAEGVHAQRAHEGLGIIQGIGGRRCQRSSFCVMDVMTIGRLHPNQERDVPPLGEPVLGTASKLSFPLGVSGVVDAWPSIVSPPSLRCPCPGTLRLLFVFVFVVVRGGTPAALALATSCVSVGFSPSASMNALNELSRSRSGTAHGNRRSIMHTLVCVSSASPMK